MAGGVILPHVCIENVGSHEILPPLQHDRPCLRSGLHCGGEGAEARH
jgi:hypothetical protein